MGNVNLDFYEENKMAPEMNENMDIFCKKRIKLYRQLGIPLISFRNSNIVEFGPNRGNNALTLLTGFNGKIQGIKHIDLFEPNPYGRLEIQKLFKREKIEAEKFSVYSDMLEDFNLEGKQYDFIIAEEFIHCISNWKELITSIKSIATTNTIIIITCSNEIGTYIERMKRLAGRYLVRNIEKQEDKIKKLEELFSTQLTNLKWMSRSVRSYILDMFFDEIFLCDNLMSIVDAIDEFGEEYDIMGCSQNIFIDHSWFKDLSYDYISSYKQQYHMKKHMYMIAGNNQESIRTIEENNELEKNIRRVCKLAADYEIKGKADIEELSRAVDVVSKLAQNEQMVIFNKEFIEIMTRLDKNEKVEFSGYRTWSGTFGEGSQYLSLVKK